MQDITLSALRHSAFYTPYLLTFCRDYLSQQGLRAQYQPATSFNAMLQGLYDQTIDISQSAVGASLISRDVRARQIQHFAQINSRDGFFIVARTPDEFHWHDLCGKQVLVDHLFQPLAMFRYIMQQQHIDISKIRVVDAGTVEQMVTAFGQGQGDYVHLQGPYAQQLQHEQQGYIVAAIGPQIGTVAFSSLCCHQDFLGSEKLKQFMQAYQQAMLACHTEPAAQLAADVQSQFPTTDISVLIATIAAYQQMGCWSSTTIERQGYDQAIRVFLASGDIEREIAYETYVVQQ